MKGWQTRSFLEKVCFHHRKMGSGMNNGLKLPFRWGQADYRLGSHPVWQVFRCIYQVSNRPYVVGGLVCLSGYYFSLITRRPRAVSAEFAKFRGKEQMQRLKKLFAAKFLVAQGNAAAADLTTALSSSRASTEK
jgi:poly-beta-1,6-N-acetyl-D-glucosamine synthase